jgi:hypothetical protein
MTERLMNDKLKKIWKEAVWAYSRYYPGICLEGMGKTTKKPSKDTQCAR